MYVLSPGRCFTADAAAPPPTPVVAVLVATAAFEFVEAVVAVASSVPIRRLRSFVSNVMSTSFTHWFWSIMCVVVVVVAVK